MVTAFCLAVTSMIFKPSKNTVSSAAVRDVYQACLRLSVLPETIELESETLTQADVRVPESTLIKLWSLLDEQKISPGIGLAIGQTIEADSKGILASWVSQANTLGEAFDIFIKNIELMNPSEAWQIAEKGSQVTLVLEHRNTQGYPISAVERSMAAMVTWAKALCGQAFPLRRVTFHFSEPDDANLFTPIFGEQVYFEAESNSLTFDKELLNLAVISSNQLLKNLMAEKAKQVLTELSDRASLAEKVALPIHNAMTQGRAINIEQVSTALAKSRQTLYRQLKQDGTDFKTIYDSTRKKLAFSLLRQANLSISSLSLQLGFKDTSSFYKAFRRWTGMSPKQFLAEADKL